MSLSAKVVDGLVRKLQRHRHLNASILIHEGYRAPEAGVLGDIREDLAHRTDLLRLREVVHELPVGEHAEIFSRRLYVAELLEQARLVRDNLLVCLNRLVLVDAVLVEWVEHAPHELKELLVHIYVLTHAVENIFGVLAECKLGPRDLLLLRRRGLLRSSMHS